MLCYSQLRLLGTVNYMAAAKLAASRIQMKTVLLLLLLVLALLLLQLYTLYHMTTMERKEFLSRSSAGGQRRFSGVFLYFLH